MTITNNCRSRQPDNNVRIFTAVTAPGVTMITVKCTRGRDVRGDMNIFKKLFKAFSVENIIEKLSTIKRLNFTYICRSLMTTV